MEVFGMALAGLYAVATSVSSLSADAASPLPLGGTTATINCSAANPPSASVTLPNTTVSVTCAESSTVKPSAPANGGKKSDPGGGSPTEEGPTSANALQNVYLGAECTQPGVLSSVCPGATVTPAASGAKASEDSSVKVFFPQLPASAQVVCLKCQQKAVDRSVDCTAVINVAAAPPQGPQACAVLGTSVTLQINQEGGSAQFACGTNLVLMPSGATKAYADDCTTEETLKDMTRSAGTGNYVIFKVDKLKKKKLCYLCKSRASETVEKVGGTDDSCKIYVDVSGSTRHSSTVWVGVALACVAASLHFA